MILPPADMTGFCPDNRHDAVTGQGLSLLVSGLIWAMQPSCVVDLCDDRSATGGVFLHAAAGTDAVREIWAVGLSERPKRRRRTANATSKKVTAPAPRGDLRVRLMDAAPVKAAAAFAPGSVDMLHVASAADAGALRAIIAAWLPAMAPSGVILLQNIMNLADPPASVWREIAAAHPDRTFAPAMAQGLGIWCLGTGNTDEICRFVVQDPTGARGASTAIARAERPDPIAVKPQPPVCRACAKAPPRAARATTITRAAAKPQAGRADTDVARDDALADAIWAKFEPRIDALVQAGVTAMQRRIEGQLAATLRKKAPDLYAQMEPLIRQAIKHKNDVQDDAIIGIGAKVDAQDAAIVDLVEHVRRVLAHPIFRR